MNTIKEKLITLRSVLAYKPDCIAELDIVTSILESISGGQESEYLVVPTWKIIDGIDFKKDEKVSFEMSKREIRLCMKKSYIGLTEMLNDKELSEKLNKHLKEELFDYLENE